MGVRGGCSPSRRVLLIRVASVNGSGSWGSTSFAPSTLRFVS